MADLLLVQGAPLFDLDGAILAGGSVTFYRSGTTTLADIWADADATVPLANPLDADAQGYIVPVFYSGAYAIRAVLRDADGARVRTIDPLPRGNVSTAGASEVSFLPIVGNDGTDVQEAIANNTGRLEALDEALGTAAYADLTESTGDATPGRVLKAGDFGWGGSVAPPLTGAGAADALTAGGVWRVAAEDVATVGAPAGAAAGVLLHLPYTSALTGVQLYFNAGSPTRGWLRRRSGGVWQAWVEFATSDNTSGFGQTWQDMSGSRMHSTAYQNTTGRPIVVCVKLDNDAARTFDLSADGAAWVSVAVGSGAAGVAVTAIVPNGHYYRASGALAGDSPWAELR